MSVFDPHQEMLKTAHRVGGALKHSTKIGAGAGAAYNVGKVGYYRARQKLAKDPRKKKGYGLMAKGTSKQFGRHVATGAIWGYTSKFLATPATVLGVKGQNVYHMAAHKAGRFKRRAERAGTPGFDPRGFPIKPRKAPSPKAKRVISGFLKATNEDKMDKAQLKGIAAKAGTDTLRTKKVFRAGGRNSREAMLSAVARKMTTGDPNAAQDVVAKAEKTASKVYARPLVTSAEAKDRVAATIKKQVKKIKQTDFSGHGRSLGTNEAVVTRDEKAVAQNPMARKKYWKTRRQQSRQRIWRNTKASAARGFKHGAAVSMGAAGLAVGAAGGFGETPTAWAKRQVSQQAGERISKALSRLPKGVKAWHAIAAPTVIGAVGGAAVGAARGFRQRSHPWHASREHNYAVRKALRKETSREKAKGYNRIIPKRNEETVMTREELTETIIESTLMDKMFIPKNEKQRKKLAKRSTAGHIAHGAMRGAIGAPFALGPGVFNVLRYASKVDAAKKGYHRNEAIEAILETFKGKIYSRQDRYGDETVVQKELRRGLSKAHAKVADPKNLGAVTTVATTERKTRRYASSLRPNEMKPSSDEAKFRAALKILAAKKK